MYVHVFTFVRKRGVESSVLLILPIQGIYKTFTRGMFRVGGNCNFPILCAHFQISQSDRTYMLGFP